jgi:hypothetical protein
MFTPVGPVPFYASGWFTKMINERRAVGHGGGAPGVNAEFRRYLDDNYTVIVLSNYDMGATPLTDEIEKLLFGLPYTVPTQADADSTRAQQFIDSNQVPSALLILDRLASSEKPNVQALYLSAKLRIVGKIEVEKALPALTRYIELADADTQPSKAAAWWRKGNGYEEAVKLDPNDDDYKSALAKLNGASQ